MSYTERLNLKTQVETDLKSAIYLSLTISCDREQTKTSLDALLFECSLSLYL